MTKNIAQENFKDSNVTSKYMEFNLGTETFAIPLLTVKEVIAIPQFTPIPFTPKYFTGVMDLRGQVLSVIDLRLKMAITPIKDRFEEGIIIVDMKPLTLGVIVDSINSVLSVSAAEINQPPNLVESTQHSYISGVYQKYNYV